MPTSVPAGTGYVAGAILSTVFLFVYQIRLTSKWRRISGIEYPRAYADKEEMNANPNAVVFNCAQRAHQNTIENIIAIYPMTLITSIKHPYITAAAVGLWTLSRLSYTRGYVTGDPQKRYTFISVLHYPIITGHMLACVYVVGQLIYEELTL
ncbi:hypothetical protein B0H16DRAFT_1537943 [Mycena metata]|uniref:Microsomal glutathione S-transferase 3 n=1 Tax=Mycena metata TaxID=1033252 RepID=A0AAD7J4S4_9AGAR|nr:hypothetical protein B0H16DRAFT_1537943 [Mycena metata]